MGSKAKVPVTPTARLDAILRPIRDALRQSCSRTDLSWNEIAQTSASRVLYALWGSGAVSARTDRACVLNQLFPKTNPNLWIGILLELRKHSPQGLYEVFHVSIQAFEGTTSQSLEPLLRAEWDTIISRSRQGPAQPHWHAYAKPAAPLHKRFLQGNPNGFVEAQQPFESSKQRQHKIHFALCANWHKEGESHFEVLTTADELRRWVIGAIEYIRSQL
jgi:hypothetical protein